jgi:hypothetical protein
VTVKPLRVLCSAWTQIPQLSETLPQEEIHHTASGVLDFRIGNLKCSGQQAASKSASRAKVPRATLSTTGGIMRPARLGHVPCYTAPRKPRTTATASCRSPAAASSSPASARKTP